MFTSRSEYRLLLREDNADIRLLEYAKKYKLVDEEYIKKTEKKIEDIKEALEYLRENFVTPTKEFIERLSEIGEEKINDKTYLIDLLARYTMTKEKLFKIVPEV